MKAVSGAVWQALRDSFIGGPSLFWLAPTIPLLLLIPEMAQHVAEIRIGMFESLDAARSLANSPTRWAFGYVKIAGIFLTLLAAARYWGGLRERWWDWRTVAWRPFLIGLAINVALSAASFVMERVLDPVTNGIASQAFMLATLPFLLLVIGPLLGDRGMTLRRAYTRGWPALLLVVALAGLAFGVGQWLHQLNHRWALGAPEATLWALMIWDAVWTALFVTCAGSALGAGYCAVFGSNRSAVAT
jgi:hypothetical protein